jgi:hypothetical protein
VKYVAAVLADFGRKRGPLTAARALLGAARHPEQAPHQQCDYHDKHDDDRDRHPNLPPVRFAPGTERTIAAGIGGASPAACRSSSFDRRAVGRSKRGGDQGRAGDHEAERDHPSRNPHRPRPDRVTEDQDAAEDRGEVGRDGGERDDLDAGRGYSRPSAPTISAATRP